MLADKWTSSVQIKIIVFQRFPPLKVTCREVVHSWGLNVLLTDTHTKQTNIIHKILSFSLSKQGGIFNGVGGGREKNMGEFEIHRQWDFETHTFYSLLSVKIDVMRERSNEVLIGYCFFLKCTFSELCQFCRWPTCQKVVAWSAASTHWHRGRERRRREGPSTNAVGPRVQNAF